MKPIASTSGTAVPVIDRVFTWSIIPVRKRPRSSMAEQLPLKQFVEGSSPPGVTKIKEPNTWFSSVRFFDLKNECTPNDLAQSDEVNYEAMRNLR